MLISATLGSLFPTRRKTKIKIYGKQETSSTVSRSPVKVTSTTRTPARRPAVAAETKKLWLGVGLAAAIVVMSVAHLFSVNYNVGIGYKVSSAQKRLAVLKEENKRLMLKSSETGSIASIQENFSAENYVPVTSIEYVNIKPDTAVSMK